MSGNEEYVRIESVYTWNSFLHFTRRMTGKRSLFITSYARAKKTRSPKRIKIG